MNALGHNGAWPQAVDLIRSMRRSGRLKEHDAAVGSTRNDADEKGANAAAATLVPAAGQSAFGCACHACARAGRWDAVLGLMADMREDGVARNAAIYASLIRALAEGGEWERAVELVRVEVMRFTLLLLLLFLKSRGTRHPSIAQSIAV